VAQGIWMPGPDMGVRAESAARFLQHASGGRRHPPRSWWTSGVSTARSMAAAVEWGLGQLRRQLSGATVALVGIGQVGLPTARLLAARGARIVGVATWHGAWSHPVSIPLQTVAEQGPERADVTPITFAELLHLPVDVLILAGPDGALAAPSAAGVQARLVASAALIPTTPVVEAELARREILVLPVPICSWGGVLGGALQSCGVPPRTIGAIIATATRLGLSRARRRARSDGGVFNLQSVVATWAEKRAAHLEAAFASPGPWRHARGLLPLWLYA